MASAGFGGNPTKSCVTRRNQTWRLAAGAAVSPALRSRAWTKASTGELHSTSAGGGGADWEMGSKTDHSAWARPERPATNPSRMHAFIVCIIARSGGGWGAIPASRPVNAKAQRSNGTRQALAATKRFAIQRRFHQSPQVNLLLNQRKDAELQVAFLFAVLPSLPGETGAIRAELHETAVLHFRHVRCTAIRTTKTDVAWLRTEDSNFCKDISRW